MGLENHRELYQQVILEHNRKPRNNRKMENPTHTAEGYNPLCGDHLTLYLQLGKDGVISDICFEGDGCAISRASASLMTDAVKGLTIDEAGELFEEFHKLIKGELDPEKDTHHLKKMTIFSGIWRYPSRVKCASLSWHAMRGALNKEKMISTE
jgi:nitrogen fixation NifU-like protein